MSGVEEPIQVTEFDILISSSLKDFLAVSTSLGEPLATLGFNVKIVFDTARDTIHYGLGNSEPPSDSAVLTRYFDSIKTLVGYAENAPKAYPDYANHFAAIKESICGIGWIQVKNKPSQFVRDMIDAGQYYAIRVQTAHKGNKGQMDWVSKWNSVMQDLHKYVQRNFMLGFQWGTGGTFDRTGAPPPPPPPEFGPLMMFVGGGDARRELLNDLNQGADITRHLKPVKLGKAVEAPKKPQRLPGKPALPKNVLPPKLALEGKKWAVEFQIDKRDLNISPSDMSESVSMYECSGCTLRVKNKMNNISIDSCKKSSVVVSDIISGVELIRCTSMKIQLEGTTPIITLDNCDSVEIYVSPKALNVEIISSKSSSLNVCVLKEDGEFVKELAMPEQIKTTIVGNPPALMSAVIDKI